MVEVDSDDGNLEESQAMDTLGVPDSESDRSDDEQGG